MRASCRLIGGSVRFPVRSHAVSPVSVLYSFQTGHRLSSKSRIVVHAEPAQTEEKASPVRQVDDCEYNIGAYCSIDAEGERVETRTLGEMEQEFLEAMQAWYFEGKSIMSDEEFENLKDELTWQGSEVAMLSSTEQKFLEASMGYASGKPLMSDSEYDALKQQLKQQGSFVALSGPRCSIRSRAMYSDLQVDYLRMTALNIPAVSIVLGTLFFFDDITGFEISKLIELPEPWGIIMLWSFVLPACFILSQQLTNLVLRDGVILTGQCPNCGAENRSYFGSIFVVEGNKDTALVKCNQCEAKLEFRRQSREIVVVPDDMPSK
eukprot:g5989.t1